MIPKKHGFLDYIKDSESHGIFAKTNLLFRISEIKGGSEQSNPNWRKETYLFQVTRRSEWL
jgi:hypothetical protein